MAVPPSAPPCVDEPLQYLGPTPVTTAPPPAALPAYTAVAVRPLLSPDYEAVAVPFLASPCMESNSAPFGPTSAPTAPAHALAHLD